MNILRKLIGEIVQTELAGKKMIIGVVIDIGSDIIVLFNGKEYVYLPWVHIKNITIGKESDIDIPFPNDAPGFQWEENISFRKVLTMAKGILVEISVSGEETITGYITSIMNNYFSFYSPLYKTMYISMNHLKWLIPHSTYQKPFGLKNHELTVQPSQLTLARTFEVQIEKMKDSLVVFNTGEPGNIKGKIHAVEGNIIEVISAKNKSIYLTFPHIKSVYGIQ
ncbi:hypothetical protein [Bacillus testis]|uniref:hypothetical protein n=1 Tax=Bacillus testis TaxID=1622072 RepID=UPI00067E77A8